MTAMARCPESADADSITRGQAASLKRPPRTVDYILWVLGKLGPEFVKQVQRDIERGRA